MDINHLSKFDVSFRGIGKSLTFFVLTFFMLRIYNINGII